MAKLTRLTFSLAHQITLFWTTTEKCRLNVGKYESFSTFSSQISRLLPMALCACLLLKPVMAQYQYGSSSLGCDPGYGTASAGYGTSGYGTQQYSPYSSSSYSGYDFCSPASHPILPVPAMVRLHMAAADMEVRVMAAMAMEVAAMAPPMVNTVQAAVTRGKFSSLVKAF